MKLIAATALAVLLACPAVAHDDREMTEENEMFSRCSYSSDVEVCEIKRKFMACEPGEKYSFSWPEFIAANGLPKPIGGGPIIHHELGPSTFILVRVDEHYGHTYTFIDLEGVVCLAAIAHFLDSPT